MVSADALPLVVLLTLLATTNALNLRCFNFEFVVEEPLNEEEVGPRGRTGIPSNVARGDYYYGTCISVHGLVVLRNLDKVYAPHSELELDVDEHSCDLDEYSGKVPPSWCTQAKPPKVYSVKRTLKETPPPEAPPRARRSRQLQTHDKAGSVAQYSILSLIPKFTDAYFQRYGDDGTGNWVYQDWTQAQWEDETFPDTSLTSPHGSLSGVFYEGSYGRLSVDKATSKFMTINMGVAKPVNPNNAGAPTHLKGCQEQSAPRRSEPLLCTRIAHDRT